MIVVALFRDVLRLSGPDTAAYLQGQVSNDVARLDVGDSCFTLVLAPQGKIEGLCRLTRVGDDEFVADTDRGHGPALLARLERFKLRTKCDIEIVEGWRAVGVRHADPGARPPAGGGIVVSADCGWADPAGYDLLGPGPFPSPWSEPGTIDAEPLRIAAGFPQMGAEATESTIPAELGSDLIDLTVSFTKGCYTGQELVARIDSRGHVNRHLRLVRAHDVPLPGPGASVTIDGVDRGTLTSAAGPVGLALVRREVEPGSSVLVGGVAATVEAVAQRSPA